MLTLQCLGRLLKTSPNSRLRVRRLIAGLRCPADALWWRTDWMLHGSPVRSTSPHPSAASSPVIRVARKWCKSIAEGLFFAAGDSPSQLCRPKISWLTVHDRWMLSSIGESYYGSEEERSGWKRFYSKPRFPAPLQSPSPAATSDLQKQENSKVPSVSQHSRWRSEVLLAPCVVVWCVLSLQQRTQFRHIAPSHGLTQKFSPYQWENRRLEQTALV